MTESVFDHEKLDVYRLSIDYVTASHQIARSLSGTTSEINGCERLNPFR